MAADPPWADDGTGPDGFAVPWSVVHGLALVAASALVPILVVAAVAALGVDLDAPLTATAVTGQALLMTLAGVVAWLSRTGRLSWRLMGPTRPRLLRDVGAGIAWAIPAGALVLSVGLLVRVAQGRSGPFAAPEPGATAVPNLVATAVVAALVAPVLLTLVHHAVLYQALRRRLPPAPAVAVSAATFAFGTPGVVTAAGLARGAVLGAWLAIVFERTRSWLVVLTTASAVGLVSLTVRVVST